MKSYIKIDGIYCSHCRSLIKKALLKNSGITECRVDGNVAVIRLRDDLSGSDISQLHHDMVNEINSLGYKTDISMICSRNKWKVKQIFFLVLIFAVILGLRYLINTVLGYDLFNVIPAIGNSLSLGAIFITGMLTSLHCVGMCGAINLVASTSRMNAFIYNIGRIMCYTAAGFVVGCVGSVLSVNKALLNIFSLAAAILMLVIGFGMTGLFTLPERFHINIKNRSSNSFVIGFLNGFVPCGPLIAMQLYAVSAADPLKSAAVMLLFGLGTMPLMLGFGMLQNLFGKHKAAIQRVMSAFIILLAFSMTVRNLSALGIDLSMSGNELEDYIASEIDEQNNIQTVKIDLTYSSYADIAVKKDIPVRFVIYGNGQLTGCNNGVICEELGFDAKLSNGENIIEFIPDEVGIYTYSCWMNMIKNTIYVYE